MAQPMTRREKRSSTATRFNQPWVVRMQVASGSPDLIASLNAKMSDAVRRNRSMVTAVCGDGAILGTLPGEDPFCAHETGDAVAPSRAAEHPSYPGATVGLTTAHKLLANASAQPAVLQLARSRVTTTLDPIIITAARD